MAITFTLIDAQANRLVYLCTQDGVVSSPPVAADGFATLPNDGGATPDLDTDSTLTAPDIDGVGGLPIRRSITARTNGYGAVAAGALTQAQARALFCCGAVAAVMTNHLVMRNRTFITPRNVAFVWAADWNVDGGGDPVCEGRSATGTAGTAVLDICAIDPFG